MANIPNSYLIEKLRATGKKAGRDALPDFRTAINAYAEKLAKLASEKCTEKGSKVISPSDINLAVNQLK